MRGVILLVEDEIELRESLAEALEGEGYTVAQAGNGKEALEYARRSSSSTCSCR